MKLKNKLALTGAATMAALFLGMNASAARMDMVDVSNNNGYMSTAEDVSMRNEFGVKALTVKISEGTTFKDSYAASNIKNGQAAGLYVNGYHFAHYATKAQAIAEADYAGQTAKAVGLPVGAVLATDVEAEQANLPKSINDANNRAFMNEIAKFGYRTDIYTSGSWANHKMTIKGKTGWIAAYPYVPAGKQWYSNNNAWQWSGSAHFRISSGDFDVSQLNNNYYTAGQHSSVKANDPGAVAQQNHQANRATGTIPNQTYTQNGLFCPNTTLNVRTGAGTGYPKIATYYPGESVIYNQVIVKADYVWARYLRYNGQFGYIALGENGGQSYGKRLVNQHTYYTIKYGDSLWAIAQRYGTTVNHLARLNGIRTTALILPGQRLAVS
ncbi:GH25 family lysozyme [Lactiplantibacillus plantarum]|uniref:GH25 family lysozyme n=1 Tax=Lactiplantibacillus plantarum TaxID=1590 RepID=UPI00309A856F